MADYLFTLIIICYILCHIDSAKLTMPDVYLGSCQTSILELFANIALFLNAMSIFLSQYCQNRHSSEAIFGKLKKLSKIGQGQNTGQR